jgi:hypothetical protein
MTAHTLADSAQLARKDHVLLHESWGITGRQPYRIPLEAGDLNGWGTLPPEDVTVRLTVAGRYASYSFHAPLKVLRPPTYIKLSHKSSHFLKSLAQSSEFECNPTC